MIYGFMSDKSLLNLAGVVEVANSPDTDVGYFSDRMANYFLTPALIRDPRDSRLTILSNKAIAGMVFNFDNDDPEIAFNDIDSDELEQLFNIMEVLYLQQDEDEAGLEAILVGDSETYGIYEADTLEVSEATTTSTVNGESTQWTDKEIRNWIAFTVRFTGDVVVEFKVWINGDSFLTDYPVSNITDVIFPCDPADLLDPSWTDVLDALSETSEWSATSESSPIQLYDHSGFRSVEVPYYNSEYGPTAYNITFKVLYKGAEPTVQEARAAIRTSIEELGLAEEEVWAALLPSLYSEAQFLLVALWDNTFEYEGTPLLSGVHNVEAFFTLMLSLFTPESSFPITESTMRANAEIFTSDAAEAFICAIAHPENSPGYTSILTLHSTYQVNPATLESMESETQTFREKLALAIAVAMGTTEELGDLVINTFDDRNYVSFTVGLVEYHLLMPEEE